MPSNLDAQSIAPHPDHDHQACIDSALTAARELCRDKQQKLTKTREKVLQLIWGSHRPIGAYSLMDALAEGEQKRVAPPTVYRALDFLLELGLIHRINSLNAYIGCQDPSHEHHCYFLICTSCNLAVETDPGPFQSAVGQLKQESGFEIRQQNMEFNGLCPHCQEQPE